MQDSIYARAGRPGGLGDILALDEIVRLGTCSLDNPYGMIHVPQQDKLYKLVKMGRLVPARTEEVPVTVLPLLSVIGPNRKGEPPRTRLEKRYYIHRADLLPHLKDLGDIGPFLVGWCSPDETATQPNVAAPEETRSQAGDFKNPVPSWFNNALRQHMLKERVEMGAQSENKPVNWGSEFSAPAVVLAMKSLGLIPKECDDKTTAEAVRNHDLFKGVIWGTRVPGAKNFAELVKWYEVGRADAERRSTAGAAEQRELIQPVQCKR